MTNKVITLTTLILAALLAMWSCKPIESGGEGGETPAPSFDPKIMNIDSFGFAMADNSSILKKDIKTTIKGTVIDDQGGVDYNLDSHTLIANFKTSSTDEVSQIKVSIGNKGDEKSFRQIISHKTPADYLKPVVIRISGQYQGRTISKDYDFRLHNLNTGLPVMYVFTPDGGDITSREEWTLDCRIFIDAAGKKDYDGTEFTEDYDGSLDKVRGRGNTTWGNRKKPYAIKLDKKAGLLGMPKHKRWVLMASAIDRSLMRNRIAYELAARCSGLEWTPRSCYVELVLNGKHLGNYQLMEQIKCDNDRVPIPSGNDALDPNEGGSMGADPSGMGFLIEVDRYWGDSNYETSPFWWMSKRYDGHGTTSYINGDIVSWAKSLSFPTNYRDGSGQLKMKYGLKDPDDEKFFHTGAPQFQYIKDRIMSVEKAVLGPTHNIDGIDIDSFIDYWFVYELTMNQEPNNPGSCYMYKKPESEGGKIFAGPVWDFDYGTFDPHFYDSGLYYGKENRFLIMNSLWYVGLFENSAFRQRVKQRWAELKPKFDMGTFVDQHKLYLMKSSELNYRIWPDCGSGENNPNADKNMDMNSAIDKLHRHLRDRIVTLDRLISSMPD